jgi:glycosyltransferase involved in cell wall biosynthesis
MVKNTYNDVNLTIAGPITSNKYQEYCEREGISKNVTFVGSKKSSQLSDLYNETEIFVCPSTNENFPSTLLEAMHCGTSIIATNVGNIPQLIKNGINGQLVEIEDEVGIANAILKYLDNRKFMNEIAKKGFESVNGRFDWNSKIEKTNNIFVSALR